MKVADVIMPRMWWMTHRHALSLCSAVCVVCGREGRGRPKFGGGTPGNTTQCRLSWVLQSSTKLGISSCRKQLFLTPLTSLPAAWSLPTGAGNASSSKTCDEEAGTAHSRKRRPSLNHVKLLSR